MTQHIEAWRKLQQLEEERAYIVLNHVLALMKDLGIYKPASRNEKLFDAIKEFME